MTLLDAKLTFIGACQQVTGSCHLLEFGGQCILLDCGMPQGGDQLKNLADFKFCFNPSSIDAVILSHVHIDHSGLLPLLVRQGFDGVIYCTAQSAELLPVLLKDSIGLYLADLERENRHKPSAQRIAPVMDLNDVERTSLSVRPLPYDSTIVLTEGLRFSLQDAGHILGSAIIRLELQRQEQRCVLVFSGDLGNPQSVLMNQAVLPIDADIIIMEGTYGDRDHKTAADTIAEFSQILAEAAKGGGNVYIPAFALGRSQEVIYFLAMLYFQGLLPQRMIFLDSPMAIDVVSIYSHFFATLNQRDLAKINNVISADFERLLPILRLTRTSEQSIAINRIADGAVVIAGSGMCNGGRILHHFRHCLANDHHHVVFVGFQAQGTLGRRLIDGQNLVRIHGDEIHVKAKLHTIGGFSAHAGQTDLVRWAQAAKPGCRFFLVHGEVQALEVLQAKLQQHGHATAIPHPLEVLHW
jgi:metallo-beta-lactamase family protein